MFDNQKIIGLIPARAGSKRIRNKNIIPVNARPLIYYTISDALKSEYLDSVIVSTDSELIRALAIYYGASVPFLRPSNLAEDKTPDFPVVEHMLTFFDGVDIIVYLKPTSPLRSFDTIDKAIECFCVSNADSCRSVSLVRQHPDWMTSIDKHGYLKSYNNLDLNNLPLSQALKKIYIVDGLIDLFRAKNIKQGYLYGKNILPFLSPEKEVLDIDTYDDLRKFEMILNG